MEKRKREEEARGDEKERKLMFFRQRLVVGYNVQLWTSVFDNSRRER